MGLCLLFGTGCFDAPPEAKARLEKIRAEGEELNEAIDEVGGRLLGGRAVVSLWQEMGWRHRSVSAIACETAQTHVEAMVKHERKQDKRSRKIRRLARASEVAHKSSEEAGRSRSN